MKKHKKKVFIIAEAGVNHNGKINNALRLVDIAKNAGADAVKFQTFLPGELTGNFAKNPNYIKKNNSFKVTRSELTKKLALTFEEFDRIKKYCDKKKIIFISTPDGTKSLNFLVKTLKVSFIKISSTELTNLEFLKEIAKKKKTTLLSTGLGDIKDVERAVRQITKYNKKLVIMQCTSEYPAPLNEMNINVLKTYKKKFKCQIGLSDHSEGYEAAVTSVALGATIIEKHFTINKKMRGPDHKASLSKKELTSFIKSIRNAEKVMGSEKKKITKSEQKNIFSIRRGLVAKKFISKGTMLESKLINFKRPFKEFHPYEINKVIGKKTKTNLKKDQPITKKNIK